MFGFSFGFTIGLRSIYVQPTFGYSFGYSRWPRRTRCAEKVRCVQAAAEGRMRVCAPPPAVVLGDDEAPFLHGDDEARALLSIDANVLDAASFANVLSH